MKSFVVFSCLLAVAFAKPGYLAAAPFAIVPGAPIGPDGRVVDTAEVSLAKAEHAAAHINERLNHNSEFLRSADYLVAAPAVAPATLTYAAAAPAALTYTAAAAPIAFAAPYAHQAGVIAADGRPLDTAEVAFAKAAHATAHLNEKLVHASEAARNYFF